MVTVNDEYVIGQRVMDREARRLGKLLPGSPEDLRFREFFGVSAEVAVEAWQLMDGHNFLPPHPQFLHYLWALAFMQTYSPNNKALSRSLGGSDPKMIHKYMWSCIDLIFDLDEILIVFENRKEGDVGNDCLLSVDGTDFRLAMGWDKSFYDYKFKRSGYRYEVGLCICSGNICWWNGPYEPGDWKDEMIFKDALAKNLEEYEQCETDWGYRGSTPGLVKCPGGLLADPDPSVKAMSARVRSRQETVNEQFKNWEI